MAAIAKDSIVLVTGCNGFIGSHIVDQLLKAGYNVRGTTRDLKKVENLAKIWKEKYGSQKFEVLVVQEMAEDGAFDEAVKGVSAIAHVASNLTFNSDPNAVIPQVISGVQSILKSAASAPTVKRFVFTSSSTAACSPTPNKKFHVDSNTWNDAVIDEAWAPPPYEPTRAFDVYSASKVEAERALWEFVKEKKPDFVVNAVLPGTVFGTILDKNLPASTAGFVTKLYQGEQQYVPPQYFVDVKDVALLHLACLTDDSIKNERLLAWAEPWNWNDVLKIMRRLRPNEKFLDDYVDGRDLSTVDNARPIDILKTLSKAGFTSLEESIKDNIEGL